jgi:hypothetical protein
MWQELQIPNVFTLETSFCGPNQGSKQNEHFQAQDLMEIGKSILNALAIY